MALEKIREILRIVHEEVSDRDARTAQGRNDRSTVGELELGRQEEH